MKGLKMKKFRIKEQANGQCVVEFTRGVCKFWWLDRHFLNLKVAKKYVESEIEKEKGRKIVKIHDYPLDSTD